MFHDRTHAGGLLASALERFAGERNTIALALPRGGVPVAFEVARRLQLSLDVLVVRKIGVPRRPELAMGAVAADGTYGVQSDVVVAMGIPRDQFLVAYMNELSEARRRDALYRDGNTAPMLAGRSVILIDDGLATGATMRVAADAACRQGARRVTVAVPVAPHDSRERVLQYADDFVAIEERRDFRAVGANYAHFSQVADSEVQEILRKFAAGTRAA